MIEGPKIKWSTDRLIANKNEKKKTTNFYYRIRLKFIDQDKEYCVVMVINCCKYL